MHHGANRWNLCIRDVGRALGRSVARKETMSYYSDALSRAVEVFGSTERAEDWLEKMSAELGSAPTKLLKTKDGYDRVLRHLHSVDLALHMD